MKIIVIIKYEKINNKNKKKLKYVPRIIVIIKYEKINNKNH